MSSEIIVQQLQLEEFEPILQVAVALPVRKQIYYPIDLPHPSIPRPIGEMGERLANEFKQPFNTAILKHYDHLYPSDAYRVHRDPDHFAGRIAMLSLNNAAGLTLYGLDAIERQLCEAGTLVVCDANLKHKVSSPIEEGLRYFVFYGYDIRQNSR